MKDRIFNPLSFRFYTSEPELEELKNRLLAAIYNQNFSSALTSYIQISRKVKKLDFNMEEQDEKTLRQIQTAIKRLGDPIPAFENYFRYQKKFSAIYQDIQQLLRRIVHFQSAHINYTEYDQWEAHVNLKSWQLNRLFATAITLQLTKGCSNFCRRCNEWAIPKVRKHFSFNGVCDLLKQSKKQYNIDLALYGASDPLDWSHKNRTLTDITYLYAPGTNYSILTKVPKNKEYLIKIIIEKKIDFSISLTNRNRTKIKSIEKKIGRRLAKQHDTDDLVIPAGLDENFTSIKSSITDAYGTEITPEGAWIIIPTFTSALHPMGHQKIPVTRDTPFFPKRLFGRKALLKDYFKPLEVTEKNGTTFFLNVLIDVQVETLLLDNGSEELTPPGMRSLKEYFSIFDDKARRKRKTITRAIIYRLKQKYIGTYKTGFHCHFKKLSEEKKKEYRTKIKMHLDMCKKETVIEAKKYAAAFFFTQVTEYIKRNHVKTEIIKFLIKDEIATISESFKAIDFTSASPCSILFSDSENFYQKFRFFIVILITRTPCSGLKKFIKKYASRFDPLLDRFVKF